MRRAFLATALLAPALVACTPPPPAPPPDPLAYIPEHRLAVGYIDVAEAYPPPATGSFIDSRRSEELATLTKDYLSQKLAAAGGGTSARASILQASVVEERTGPSTWGTTVTNAPDATLRAVVEVKLAIIADDGKELAYATAKVERARTVRNLTSVAEREAMAQELIQRLMLELDGALSQSVRQNLAGYMTL